MDSGISNLSQNVAPWAYNTFHEQRVPQRDDRNARIITGKQETIKSFRFQLFSLYMNIILINEAKY